MACTQCESRAEVLTRARLPQKYFSDQTSYFGGTEMLTSGSILVSLLWLVEQIPTPPPPVKRQRGRQEFYSDKLFVKALIVMIIRRLYTAYALLSFLDQADPVAQQIRPLLTEQGRFPTRRTWERRFESLPARLPALIGCLGRHLVTLLQPWVTQGRAAAVD